MGGRQSHGRLPIRAGQGQRADTGGRPGGTTVGRGTSCRRSAATRCSSPAALPVQIFPPLFNRYSGGQSFGTHVDNAVRQVPGSGHRIRTDLSVTLFLAGPDEYDGGELCIEDTYGMQKGETAGGAPGALSRHEPAPGAGRSPAERGSARSSGFRAWCATMPAARYCSISTGHPAAESRKSQSSGSGAIYRSVPQLCYGSGRRSSGPPFFL